MNTIFDFLFHASFYNINTSINDMLDVNSFHLESFIDAVSILDSSRINVLAFS